METVLTILLCLFGYLSGSVLFAPLVCQLLNAPPPHLYGSRNPGATNVYRIAGPGPALLTLAGDAFKGWLPVAVAHWAGASPAILAIVALCAIAGHMLPLFSRFRGGKGVATTLGAGVALAPATILVLVIIWLLVMKRYRIVAVASLAAAVAGPIVSFWLNPETVGVFLIIMLILLVRHRDNLVRLAEGRETPFS